MKLEQLQISNFKGLKAAHVKFDSFDCLVGENNSGKSSVLQSVVWELGRSGTLPISLYYDPGAVVQFDLIFTEIDHADLLRLTVD